MPYLGQKLLFLEHPQSVPCKNILPLLSSNPCPQYLLKLQFLVAIRVIRAEQYLFTAIFFYYHFNNNGGRYNGSVHKEVYPYIHGMEKRFTRICEMGEDKWYSRIAVGKLNKAI